MIPNEIYKSIAFILLFLCPAYSNGQLPFAQNHDFGLALSYAPNQLAGALSWKQMHGITTAKKFKLGYGLRFNTYQATNRNYITAPAELTSGEKGPQVLFINNIESNIDTFLVSNALHNSLNAAIYFEYNLSQKWGIGFNIDAGGIAFGKKVLGELISSDKPTNSTSQIQATPTNYNLLLISDNDIGMLNSELYISYRLNKNLSVNTGFTFLFTEYTTDEKIAYNSNNDRFRYKSLLGMLSIQYRPFKKK